jgi:hypothetical protein
MLGGIVAEEMYDSARFPTKGHGGVTVTRTLILLSLFSLHCSLPESPDLISSLRFTPSAFDSFRRNTELRYSLKSFQTVNIYIVRKELSGDLLVKTLAEGLGETKGSHAITWLGDTNAKLFAPAGVYFGVVQLHDKRFEAVVEVFHF